MECSINIEFDKLTEERKIVQIVTTKNIRKIFKHYSNSIIPEHLRNYLMYSLLLDTGLRISELLSLKVSDIDFEIKTIHVKITKTKTERYVFYTDSTQRLLRRFISNNKIQNQIFISLATRKVISIDTVLTIGNRLRKTLRIKQSISPHKWRHTFATNFVNKNGNMEVLRIILGHSNLSTTQRYLHVDSNKLRDEYNRLF